MSLSLSLTSPLYWYDFENVTDFSTVSNLGSDPSFTLNTLNASIISTNSATGTHCLQFVRNKTNYAVLPSWSNYNTSFTLCFWYLKTSGTISEADDVKLVSFNETTFNANTEFSIRINGTTGYMFLLANGTSTTFCPCNCCDGTWRHLAITYDVSSHKLHFYFNGIICANSLSGISFSDCTFSHNRIGTGYDDVTKCATLLIDDFRVYNGQALSIERVASICGNNAFYTSTPPVLLNTLFDSLLPNMSQASMTGFSTLFAKQNVDLNKLYAMYQTGNSVRSTHIYKNIANYSFGFISSLTNFFSAESTNVVLSSGNKVQRWNDISGHNAHATQSNSNLQPLFQSTSTEMNSKPCIVFDGVTQSQMLKCPCFRSTSFTFCIAGYILTNTNQQHMISSDSVWGAECFRLYFNNLQTIVQIFTPPIWGLTLTSPFIFTLTAHTTSPTSIDISAYLNGGSAYTVTSTVPSSYININNLCIGGWSFQPQSTFKGGLSSLLCFNGVLTQHEREQVEGYLAWKWWNSGTSILNSSHLYYSTPPTDIGTIFNALTHSV